MTSSARDVRYGRRGGRWADTWTTADEARYQAALPEPQPQELAEQPDLFTDNDDRQETPT